MRRVVLSMLLVLGAAGAVRAAESLEGHWGGVLDVGGTQLTLITHFTRDGNAWKGTMDSVSQGAMGLAMDLVSFEAGKLHFDMKAIGGQYDGEMAADGNSIVGHWKQSGLDLPLEFKRTADPSSLAPKRPQEPRPPLPYDEQEVSYENPRAKITISGTLALPRTPGPHPAVLLITGSGPQDRNETLAGHRPFLVLSDHLVRAGIAVLRVDDRGVGKTTGSFEQATTADFADDARAGVAYLQTRTEIDPKRIGLVGHSEGGVVAPMVAAGSLDVAFIVMMAGVGVPADQLSIRQSELMMRAGGTPDVLVAANREALEKMFRIVREDPDPASAGPRLQAVGDDLKNTFTAMDPSLAQVVGAQVDASVSMINSPWFRRLLTLDPAATLGKVKVPVLAINGSLDLQVDPKQNLPAIEQALRDGGNKDVTVRELPGLNHLFQTATTGSMTEYGTIEETMAPLAMQTISDWILAKTKR